MAAAQYFTQVQKIYIAFYQRPADPAGLKYWADRVDAAGGNINQVVAAFASSPEATALYGPIDNSTIGTVVDKLFMALFNKAPDAAGKKFYVDGFTAGTFTAGSIALAVLNGAQNDDLVAVNNKVQVANEFTQQVDGRPLSDAFFGTGTAFDVTYDGADVVAARSILKAVNEMPSTVLDASGVTEVLKTQIANAGDPIQGQTGGQTFTLTVGIDNVVGTNGNDVIIGDSTSGNPGDQIDGGAGVDTLKLTNFGQGNLTALPQVKNVENISLVGFNNAAALDVAAVTGLNTLTIENNPLKNVSITGLSGAQSLGVTNVSDNTKTIGGTYGATDAAASLVVTGSKDAGAVTFTGAKIETVNLNSTGTTASKLASVVVAGGGTLKNLVITGDQGVTVTTALTANTVKVDGSASTGGFTLNQVALTKDLAVTGGSGKDSFTLVGGGSKSATIAMGAGDDKVSLGDLATYAATSSFAGGDGTDTIVISNGAGLTAVTGKQITGFETLDLAKGTGIYDVSFLAGGNTISTVQVSADLTANSTVKNVLSGSAVNLLATTTKDLTVEVKDAVSGKADSLTVNIGGAAAVTASKIVVNEVETVTLNSTSKLVTFNNAVDTNTVTSLNTDKATTLVITGDKTLTLSAVVDTVLSKIDASAFTGNFVMGAATTASSILGGSGNDTLFSAANGSTINAAKGNDTINLTASTANKDVLILNNGDAKAVVTAGALDTGKIESIINFKTGQDVIDLGAFGFTGQQKSALAVKGVVTAAALGADVTDFFVDTGVARGVAVATVGPDQYLFVDANKDGNFNVASDLVIKLVGSDVANFADIGF